MKVTTILLCIFFLSLGVTFALVIDESKEDDLTQDDLNVKNQQIQWMNTRFPQANIKLVEFKRIKTTETPSITYLIEIITGSGRQTSLRSFVHPSIVNLYHDDKDMDNVIRITQRGVAKDATSSMKRTMQQIVEEINRKHFQYNFQVMHISNPNSDNNSVIIRAEVISITDLVNDQSGFNVVTGVDYLFKRSLFKALDSLTKIAKKPVTIQEIIAFETTQTPSYNYIAKVYPRVSAPIDSMVMQSFISLAYYRDNNNNNINEIVRKIIEEANSSKLVKGDLSLSKVVMTSNEVTDEGNFLAIIVEVFYK
jgi:hypothetical protein